jgi:hypothetical protein
MRELNVNEIEQVNAGSPRALAAEGGVLGMIAGGALTGSINGTTRRGAFGVLVGVTYSAIH